MQRVDLFCERAITCESHEECLPWPVNGYLILKPVAGGGSWYFRGWFHPGHVKLCSNLPQNFVQECRNAPKQTEWGEIQRFKPLRNRLSVI